jgi:hypothetical protein
VRVSVWGRQQQTQNIYGVMEECDDDETVHRIVKFHKIRSNYLFGKAIGSSSLGFFGPIVRDGRPLGRKKKNPQQPHIICLREGGGSRFLLCCTTHDLHNHEKPNFIVPNAAIAIATTFVSLTVITAS